MTALLTELFFWQIVSMIFGAAFCIVALIALVQSMYIESYKKDHWWRSDHWWQG